ncbi:MAG: hypothetical protein DCF16_04860 [Alphaproteobacteria bacterium]|nr:MAG: hypothetical protein DCF16_04860 [Alphaproteobacteria bacterium]
MRSLLGGIAAAFAFFFIAAAPAAAESIECPLSQARRTITNELPSGWWTTPIVNTLTETRVQDIGGDPALMCVYGPSGSVQRNAPANHNCTARTGGFECTPRIRLTPIPIPTPTLPSPPQTHSTNSLEVPQTWSFDLDAGNVGADGADLWFRAETNTALFIEPRNGAQIALGDRSNRGRDGCAAASFSTTRVPLASIPVGSYVCVRTNEGRISQFRMNAISASSPRTLSIGYTTWR